jgi:hypothetical protein
MGRRSPSPGRRLHAAGSLLAAAAAVAATPLAAVAAPANSSGHTIYQSRYLWATIDVCNTPAHPHTVGVRASMPGSGIAREQMLMRFAIQYRDASGAWLNLGAAGDSGFVGVGSSSFKARQSGRSFQLTLAPGSSVIVRGVVTFEWLRRGHVVRHAQKQTTAGHDSVANADPRGYSAAACELA